MAEALAVTSLLLQLFGAALEGCYSLFRCAADADAELKKLVLRLKIEQCRLSEWGELTGLSGSEKSQIYTRHVKAHEKLIADVLTRIKTVLDGLALLVEFHDPASTPAIRPSVDANAARTLDISGPLDQSSAVYKVYGELAEVVDRSKMISPSSKHPRGTNHLFRFLEDILKVSTEPKRLVWAIRDRKRFCEELDILRDLTDHLHEEVSGDQVEQLLQWSHETWLAVLQLSVTVEDMKVLLAAQQDMSHHGRGQERKAEKLESQLHTTIQTATSFAIRMSTLERDSSMLLVVHNFPSPKQLLEEDDGYRTLTSLNGKPVWIEWRDYKEVPVLSERGTWEPGTDLQSVQNVERLTWLLSQADRPAEFHLPKCSGYIDDPKRLRFGVVLESLSGRSHSLLSWFGGPEIDIDDRYMIARQIAESLLYLHAVNWLHKGLRSAGVVFAKAASDSGEDSSRLLVSGFGFSRPTDHSFTTDGPPHDRKWSLYCHPEYLDSDAKAGYRKSYDVYSLGIILIEIAHWKPIDKILKSLRSGRDSALGEQEQDDRVRILESDTVLRQVRQHMGPRYANATRACIEGVTAFGLQSGVDESNPYVAALLQQAFIDVVVDPLKGIVV
ncbi:hypothetical protein D6C81_10591 [Aureobasidium pullulans]|uniref:Protein kinase domain-containing protein n=1 Tax=Aureobasidium pullulans TaxID=5580 RepID=A0A4S9ZG09_AURPU|nr:hypothetical protein D6D22_00412 [Aureobasidium pullulans]THX29709.1 hypothetical protein D6D12_04022 [Aureobasidium pullulans]TIA04594.1 hypothetical protein D6C81_10591 [Aureobasidium pullulans]